MVVVAIQIDAAGVIIVLPLRYPSIPIESAAIRGLPGSVDVESAWPPFGQMDCGLGAWYP